MGAQKLSEKLLREKFFSNLSKIDNFCAKMIENELC